MISASWWPLLALALGLVTGGCGAKTDLRAALRTTAPDAAAQLRDAAQAPDAAAQAPDAAEQTPDLGRTSLPCGGPVRALQTTRLWAAIPVAASNLFLPRRADLEVDTRQWERRPWAVAEVDLGLRELTRGDRVTLAADSLGLRGVDVDNFVLFEIVRATGRREAFFVGVSAVLRRDGERVPHIGVDAMSLPASAPDLASQLPVGEPFCLRVSLIDFGGTVMSSEVFLRVARR